MSYKALKYLTFLLSFILMMVFGFSSAKAAVPVVVFGEYLNHLYDIDDTDSGFDLQARINGTLEYSEGDPLDATVTYTQKVQGTPKDKEIILDAVINNIERTLEALEEEINQLSGDADTALNKIQIERAQKGIKELGTMKTQAENYKEMLADTIALDVHIVKDTSDKIDDFKNIAKERLARYQVGELTGLALDQYQQQMIKDYDEYLYQRPLQVAYNYLSENFFDVENASLESDVMDNTKSALETALKSSYIRSIKPEKDPEYAEAKDIFDESTEDSWYQYSLASQSKHTFPGIFLSGFDSAQEVIGDEYNKNLAQAIANQGIEPIIDDESDNQIQCLEANQQCPICNEGLCYDLSGEEKYPIKTAGSEVAYQRDAAAWVQFEMAATPEYAPERMALGVPGLPVPPHYSDNTAVGPARENVEWWDDTVTSSLNALEDIFCACFPVFCKDWNIFDLGDLIPGLEIPDKVSICGKTFHLCRYYPDICNSIEDLPEDLLDGLLDTLGLPSKLELPSVMDILKGEDIFGMDTGDIFGNIFDGGLADIFGSGLDGILGGVGGLFEGGINSFLDSLLPF